MSAILKLAVFCLAVGVTLGATCCYPRQYEGYRVHFMTFGDGQNMSQTIGFSYIAYDAVNMRQAFKESMYFNGVYFSNHIIKNHNETDVKYFISGDGTSCTKAPLEPFPEQCIEDGATKFDDGVFGLLGGEGTMFSVYNTSTAFGNAFTVTTIPDEEGTCLPIMETIGTRGAFPFMMTLMPFNLTLGIADESVFEVPDICLDAAEVGPDFIIE